ncbi:hypothetical protein [Streptomyces sp. NPDC047315]|uniref:hypothetical protein n=1 Tax=Streptomyces sp. NPDC047315 TaxID=3155142 RepID=UPI0033CEE806
MAISYMVRGDDRIECQAELDRLCERMGAVPTNPPSDRIGRGWVARAVLRTNQDEITAADE